MSKYTPAPKLSAELTGKHLDGMKEGEHFKMFFIQKKVTNHDQTFTGCVIKYTRMDRHNKSGWVEFIYFTYNEGKFLGTVFGDSVYMSVRKLKDFDTSLL